MFSSSSVFLLFALLLAAQCSNVNERAHQGRMEWFLSKFRRGSAENNSRNTQNRQQAVRVPNTSSTRLASPKVDSVISYESRNLESFLNPLIPKRDANESEIVSKAIEIEC